MSIRIFDSLKAIPNECSAVGSPIPTYNSPPSAFAKADIVLVNLAGFISLDLTFPLFVYAITLLS
jgi:hypothetical protein